VSWRWLGLIGQKVLANLYRKNPPPPPPPPPVLKDYGLEMGLFQFGSRDASFMGILSVILAFLAIIKPVMGENITYVTTTDASGKTVYLPANRQPALYTQDFGDCLGGSLLDVSRFDAAYYADNMTVTFHLQGTTQLENASVISELSRGYI